MELAARHYYGADDKLMALQRYSWRGPSLSDGTWEEYWYDALGRRVLTRARRDPSSIYDATVSGPLCMGGIQCRSFTERVWWDGDQALVEERTPEGTSDVSSSGLVGNIQGFTLDEPLAVMSDQTRIVNYNWRGQGESSVFPNGQAGDASLGNTATEIDWPALTQAQTYFTPGPGSGGSGNPKRWMGTFVANGQGTTGMLYRRNRYFDPNSGQFTQADPIGIAGGMNAFGFASGDPVNFSDPFGLSACPWHDVACWEDEMLAATGGTGIIGRVLAPLASTILELSSLSGVDRQAKIAGQSGSAGDRIMLVAQIGLAAAGSAGRMAAASERLLGEAIAGAGVRKAIAGAGSRKAIGDINRLVAQYGGEASDWAKMVGGSERVGGKLIQIHWYENVKTGLRTEFKQNIPWLVP